MTRSTTDSRLINSTRRQFSVGRPRPIEIVNCKPATVLWPGKSLSPTSSFGRKMRRGRPGGDADPKKRQTSCWRLVNVMTPCEVGRASDPSKNVVEMRRTHLDRRFRKGSSLTNREVLVRHLVRTIHELVLDFIVKRIHNQVAFSERAYDHVEEQILISPQDKSRTRSDTLPSKHSVHELC